MLVPYSPSARAILSALQSSLGGDDVISCDQVLDTLLRLPVTEFLMPRALRDDSIWQSGPRYQFQQWLSGNTNYLPPSTGGGGWQFAPFVLQLEAKALEENAPWVDEWHIAHMIAESPDVRAVGINQPALMGKLAELSGRVKSREEADRLWCFCDSNVFLQYRLFTDVDWPRGLSCGSVVLVVQAVVMRELDYFRAERQREHLRKRARSVLPRLAAAAFASRPGIPAQVRRNAELLLLGREPVAFPPGLDPSEGDDRLVASALGFPGDDLGLMLPFSRAISVSASKRGSEG